MGQAQPDDRTICERSSGQPAIEACTRAISSGVFTGLELAKLHTNRGVELKLKGDLDAALTDYDDIDPAQSGRFLRLQQSRQCPPRQGRHRGCDRRLQRSRPARACLRVGFYQPRTGAGARGRPREGARELQRRARDPREQVPQQPRRAPDRARAAARAGSELNVTAEARERNATPVPASAACSAPPRPTRLCRDCRAARPEPPARARRWRTHRARACWSR